MIRHNKEWQEQLTRLFLFSNLSGYSLESQFLKVCIPLTSSANYYSTITSGTLAALHVTGRLTWQGCVTLKLCTCLHTSAEVTTVHWRNCWHWLHYIWRLKAGFVLFKVDMLVKIFWYSLHIRYYFKLQKFLNRFSTLTYFLSLRCAPNIQIKQVVTFVLISHPPAISILNSVPRVLNKFGR